MNESVPSPCPCKKILAHSIRGYDPLKNLWDTCCEEMKQNRQTVVGLLVGQVSLGSLVSRRFSFSLFVTKGEAHNCSKDEDHQGRREEEKLEPRNELRARYRLEQNIAEGGKLD